ncbi:hypothetical protein [Butyrivibrio sp. AE3009]|uniref:hypothetical protein n=1 Tax=Butyrivibrio sp. AE3009 TaxID=1280666 RepID=UPI0003B520CC|nr:hypothetical protein [Butyrivibrio sp. AE3009]
MKEFSVPMAVVDFIPVVLFATAAIMLQRDLYSKMSKGAFALFATGTIDIIFAGSLKALYKLLYAMGVCDFQPLSHLFFPVQSIGFLLAGLGLIAMVVHRQSEGSALCVAPPLFSGTMIFVSCMVIGLALMYIVLSVIVIRLKKPFLILVFVASFLCSVAMGYLSTRDFSQAYMNWIAQGINILGQGLLVIGVILLRKYGMLELILGK